jgi:Mn2+/Fe2+ NRAMP family transporter
MSAIHCEPAAMPAEGGPRKRFLGLFGPGFVAGSSNNDPTTVASLAVVGASTGYSLAWLVLLILPMLAVVQALAAAIGTVCGTGFQAALRKRYGLGIALVSLFCIAPVSLLTLAADIKAGAEALNLLVGLPSSWLIAPIAAITALLLCTRRYAQIERILAFATLGFLAYVVSTVLAHPDWGQIVRAVAFPRFTWDAAHIGGAVALLGTTLTSYVYLWESIEVSQRKEPAAKLRSVQRDAVLGLIFPVCSFFFILVGTGATLGASGHSVETAADAARALEPLAGAFAPIVFAVGLLASTIIAVPVIAASIGYVVAETFGWRRSLDAKPAEAPGFYGIVAAAIALGTLVAFVGFAPIAFLVAASIVGGIATPVTLIMLIALARDRTLMGEHRIGVPLALAAAVVTLLVGVSGVVYLATSAPDALAIVHFATIVW